MVTDVNAAGQPVGRLIAGWSRRSRPEGGPLAGRYCRLERLCPDHAFDLFEADQADVRGEGWTYLPYGPFPDLGSYQRWVEQVSGGSDPLFYAVCDTHADLPGGVGNRAVGIASYLRVSPEAGSIEVGHVHFSPALQQRRAATEAHYLMMHHAFEDLGYRRYEWKCDALNAASRVAAARLGFRYEGTFRQALVVKGRNRDTSWYSILDQEWPAVRTALTAWLHPRNFDGKGQQKSRLSAIFAGQQRA